MNSIGCPSAGLVSAYTLKIGLKELLSELGKFLICSYLISNKHKKSVNGSFFYSPSAQVFCTTSISQNCIKLKLTAFTSNNPAFDLDWWHFIDQLHGRFLTCILEYEQESEKVHTVFLKMKQVVKLQYISRREYCKKKEPKTYQ